MYRGVIVPLVTPLDDEGNVCAASVERLIESVRETASGLMPAVSSGEGWRLSHDQWRDMLRLTRRFARGLPVCAGIALGDASLTMERAQLARQLEVDAVVAPAPFAPNLSGPEVRQHFRAIARACRRPVFVHHEPKLTGAALSLETLVDLCREGFVVGVNESSGRVALTRALVAAGTGVPVFQGWEHLCQATTPGVHGYVLPLANLEPALCRIMLDSPDDQLQAEIDRHVAAHDLFGDHWYRGLKRELRRRNVILDDREV